jgi:catechol 2,3-dioxygenase-like lactoylglutathione lyase family enzyme
MILGLDHAALAVPDIERALEFYCGVVGFEVIASYDLPAGLMETPFGIEKAGCTVRKVELGGTRLELFQFDEAEVGDVARPVNRLGITHIALRSDDVPADHARLSAAGVRFNTSPQGESPSQWCYGRDPFGNVIELFEGSVG